MLTGIAAMMVPGPVLRTAADAAPDLVRGTTFPEGVMAGVPRTDGATLWTRATLGLLQNSGKLALLVSRNEDLSSPEIVTEVTAEAQWDGCIHYPATGLRAGEQYFYQFRGKDTESPVGRFQTARPADSQAPTRIGFFTCQGFTEGYYAAHRHLAAEDLDLVVCLGDYVYEASVPGVRGIDLNLYPQVLPAMRAKYAHYRTDENLRAMHARHAFLPLWDDHEFRNDYTKNRWTLGWEPLFAAKRSAAWHTWFERMPVPRFYPDDMTRTYRSVRLGGLAEILTVDSRQYRDDQPCGDGAGVVCADADNPAREYLGAAQKAWLLDSLRGSTAPWKVLANPNMLMGMISGAQGERAFLDSWDGYGADRTELLSTIASSVDDVLVVTGDDHNSFAGELWDTGFSPTVPQGTAQPNPAGSRRAGVEFVVPSVSSPNNGDVEGAAKAGQSARNRLDRNDHLKYCEMVQHGYGVLELTPSEAQFRFRAVDKLDPHAGVTTSATFTVSRGAPVLRS
ncbi:phospholipase [Pseudonocardiaceae bacterium YIM PH 21723]|nr:phospholipase [Pseudonocardiaceae bacterium YIM PH 21723]